MCMHVTGFYVLMTSWLHVSMLQKNVSHEKADTDNSEEAVPLVPITPTEQPSVSIIIVSGLEEVKTKALIAALKECEGVQTVLPQVNILRESRRRLYAK
jgi:hypothetical protein